MSVERVLFGNMPDGREVYKYIIRNSNECAAHILTLGATLCSFEIKDKNGTVKDVLLGLDTVEDYLERADYQGVIVGPVCNRIGGASIEINGKTYPLTQNDKTNCLHSGGEFGFSLWKAIVTDSDSVEFTFVAADGSHGFPGEKTVTVVYTLDDENGLHIKYDAVCSEDMYLNLTNHAYFNLNGYDGGDILSHVLTLDADRFTEVSELLVPTGNNLEVEGTAFDFRSGRVIGKDIDADCVQLRNTGGYDHNFCVNNYDGTLRKIGEAISDVSGIKMNIYTTLPGVQFYAGNFLKGTPGKNGCPMEFRSGFCLETQFFPDTPHQPDFPSCFYKAGEHYLSETVYRFETV